jgi:hypothetical protein
VTIKLHGAAASCRWRRFTLWRTSLPVVKTANSAGAQIQDIDNNK